MATAEPTPLNQPIVTDTWREKYAAPGEGAWEDTCARVAAALAGGDPELHDQIKQAMLDREIAPAGRILAGAGTDKRVTLINCLHGSEKILTKELGATPIADAVGAVTVLTREGWRAAEVRAFGQQPVNVVTLRPAWNQRGTWRLNGRSQYCVKIKATPNHRWPLADGSVTSTLRVGDVVESCAHAVDKSSDAYLRGLRHGLIFGDGAYYGAPRIGSVHGTERHHRHILRLCGKKAELISAFADMPREHSRMNYAMISYPPSAGGDPVVGYYADFNCKALPEPGLDDDYYGGFVDGWLAADGHASKTSTSILLHSQNKQAVDWLVEQGAVAGYLVVGTRISARAGTETNLGVVSADTWCLHLRRAVEVKWKVIGIRKSEPAPVYCAIVPKIAAFALARGVYTGNCFVSADIQDSMATQPDQPGLGIMDALSAAAYTQQMGGGIGMDFSTIRPRGAVVRRTQSMSSGVLPFMDMWNAMCATIRSSGSRRGAMMATLRCDHPDIEEFIEAKQQPGRLTNFNISVLVTDDFMAAVDEDRLWELKFPVPPAGTLAALPGAAFPPAGHAYVYKTLPARQLWDKIIRATYVYAEPGVIFIDRVNKLNNLQYCEDIHCTNPCFPGETLVWTAYGPQRFDALAKSGKSIPVLTQLEDGSLAYRDMTQPRRTQRGAGLVEIIFESHSWRGKKTRTKLRCTPNHELFLLDGSRRRADELFPGDRIASVYRRKANSARAALRGSHEFVHEHWVACEYQNGRRPDYPREHAHHRDDDKTNNRPENLQILPGTEHDALKMRGDLNPMRRFPEKNPFNRSGFAAGENNGRYRDDIDGAAVAIMRASGMTVGAIAAKLECSSWTVKKRLGLCNHRVVSVRKLPARANVYCGTVKSTGRFFVLTGEGEGVLVSNCGEQPLPADGDCNLGHINLAVLIDRPFIPSAARINDSRLRQVTALMVRLLDNVLDVTQFPTPAQAREAQQKRRIGLGFTGLASALQQLCVPYGSDEAVKITRGITRTIAEAAYAESIRLAALRGSFPLYDADHFLSSPFAQKLPDRLRSRIGQQGIRNGVLMSIAPTGTTSLAYGNVSSGIEPVFAHKYRRNVRGADGELSRSYSVFDYGYLKYCQVRGFDPEGDHELPPFFVTASELTVDQHLAMAAAAQEWVDAAISKTINCPEEMTLDEFRQVYTRAYELGLKGCTTYRPDPRSGRGAVLVVEDSKPAPAATEEVAHDLAPATAQTNETPASQSSDKVAMQEVVDARRYRIKWPHEDCAYYIIITDYVDARGQRRPFELFISTKSTRHDEWVRAFSLLVTAIFRREGDPSFIIDELRQVYSAKGGAWMSKKHLPSLVAAIGAKIEDHMRWLGLLSDASELQQVLDDPAEAVKARIPEGEVVRASGEPSPDRFAGAGICDACGVRAVVRESGCKVCKACGNTNCG